jgi:uncharacterized protein YbjQ (UPF0145 family)
MKLTTTTSFDESKYEVIGIVDSLTTRAISEFRQAFAQIVGVFGGKNTGLNTKFLQARNDALKDLKEKAEAMGADMLIGVSLTTDVVNMGGTEFLTYAGLGTALRRKDGSTTDSMEGGRKKRRTTLRKKH